MDKTKVRIVYFPGEAKYSIWDKNYNLIKEWFNSRESAQIWAENNNYLVVNHF